MKKRICALLALALLLTCASAEGLLNEFDMIGRIQSQPGLYLVEKDGLWGVTDGDGNMILEVQFETVRPFEDGTAAVCKDEKWGLVSDRGEILLEPMLRSEPRFIGGYAVAAVEDRSRPTEEFSGVDGEYASSYGLIDRAGEIVIPMEYESMEMDDAGETLLVRQDELFGYMDMTGEWIVEPKYNRAYPFVDGHAAVSIRNEKVDQDNISDPFYYVWGVIDTAGKELIPLEYMAVEAGAGDLVIIPNRDYEYGYMNLSGEWVVKPKFTYAELFVDGAAITAIEVDTGVDQSSGETTVYRYGVIDETGAEILPFEYDYISRRDDGTFAATRAGIEEKTYFRIEDGKAVEVE